MERRLAALIKQKEELATLKGEDCQIEIIGNVIDLDQNNMRLS
jgi:hypothetical protein